MSEIDPGQDWLADEFAAAQRRIEELPLWARPLVRDGDGFRPVQTAEERDREGQLLATVQTVSRVVNSALDALFEAALEPVSLVWGTDLSDLSLEQLSVLRELLAGLTNELHRETAERAVAAGLAFDAGIEEIVLAGSSRRGKTGDTRSWEVSPQERWERTIAEARLLGDGYVRVKLPDHQGLETDFDARTVPDLVLRELERVPQGSWAAFSVEFRPGGFQGQFHHRNWALYGQPQNRQGATSQPDGAGWFWADMEIHSNLYDGKIWARRKGELAPHRVLWGDLPEAIQQQLHKTSVADAKVQMRYAGQFTEFKNWSL